MSLAPLCLPRISQNLSTSIHAPPPLAHATSSGASNLGPTNQKLIDAAKDRSAAYREENGLGADALVPVDAVTASAIVLDPYISPANALMQAARVAKARNLPQDQVRSLVNQVTE